MKIPISSRPTYTGQLIPQMPVKEELDEAVPPHELLDVSASRAKGELAARGGLANRHLPSLKKTTSMSSAGSQVSNFIVFFLSYLSVFWLEVDFFFFQILYNYYERIETNKKFTFLDILW